ncbi:MAG TPA: RNA polymerase sigma factor [Candidatus Limnocylindrales bacterium]|nr:RNA polymerase sigma factor [Candidatus Limnocylindrales bacterium]
MTNAELVRKGRAGDRDAFDLVMTAQIDHLYRIARLILRDTDRAEDAVQEALVRCWRDLRTLRDPDRFDAWLNRLLLRCVTDEARRERRHAASLVVLNAEPRQLDDTGTVADRDELARVFGRLSVDHRTMVVLHHYLGFTIEEAAATIGIPVGTAKSRLHYATDALRAALESDARVTATRQVMA